MLGPSLSEVCRDTVNSVPAEQKSLKRAVTALDLRFLDTDVFHLQSLWITEQATIFDENELVRIMPLSPITKMSFVSILFVFIIQQRIKTVSNLSTSHSFDVLIYE